MGFGKWLKARVTPPHKVRRWLKKNISMRNIAKGVQMYTGLPVYEGYKQVHKLREAFKKKSAPKPKVSPAKPRGPVTSYGVPIEHTKPKKPFPWLLVAGLGALFFWRK